MGEETKSVSEKSMEVMLNIIKLSSVCVVRDQNLHISWKQWMMTRISLTTFHNKLDHY